MGFSSRGEEENVVQEGGFEVHVVSKESVDGKWGLISLMYSVELIRVLIILPIIKCLYLNVVMFSAVVTFCFLKGDIQFRP